MIFLSETSHFSRENPYSTSWKTSNILNFFLSCQLRNWVDTLSRLMCQLNSSVDTLDSDNHYLCTYLRGNPHFSQENPNFTNWKTSSTLNFFLSCQLRNWVDTLNRLMRQLNSPVDTLDSDDHYLCTYLRGNPHFSQENPNFTNWKTSSTLNFFLSCQLRIAVDTLSRLMCQLNSPVDTLDSDDHYLCTYLHGNPHFHKKTPTLPTEKPPILWIFFYRANSETESTHWIG